jgi:hypothetical protein
LWYDGFTGPSHCLGFIFCLQSEIGLILLNMPETGSASWIASIAVFLPDAGVA